MEETEISPQDADRTRRDALTLVRDSNFEDWEASKWPSEPRTYPVGSGPAAFEAREEIQRVVYKPNVALAIEWGHDLGDGSAFIPQSSPLQKRSNRALEAAVLWDGEVMHSYVIVAVDSDRALYPGKRTDDDATEPRFLYKLGYLLHQRTFNELQIERGHIVTFDEYVAAVNNSQIPN